MKKAVSIFLAVIMLLACLTVFASADDPAPTPATLGTENLLALWDFESEENPYLDVINGSLIWARNGVDNAHKPEDLSVKDGVVEITAQSNMLYLQYSQRQKARYEGHENKTIYIKFYIDGIALNNDEALIWHRNNDFKVCVKDGATTDKYLFTCSFFGTDFDVPEENTPVKPADKWYYMALTMGAYNTETGKVTVNLYLSADGTTYQKTTQEIAVAAENVAAMLRPETVKATNSYFAFGKTNINYGNKEKFPASTGVNAYYDEIRFYGVALDDEQMPFLKDAVVFNTPEEGESSESTESTEEESIYTRPSAPTSTKAPETTDAPTTEAPTTEAPKSGETTTTAAGTEKTGGCKSVLTAGSLVLLLTFAAGAVAVGKKNR